MSWSRSACGKMTATFDSTASAACCRLASPVRRKSLAPTAIASTSS